MGKYQSIVCGGTFDAFHKGHEVFLKSVLELSDKVLIGITSNLYIQSFKSGLSIEDFEIRKKAVEQFLDANGSRDKVEIVPINSAYDPYLESSTKYQAIVVTPQTQNSALDINLKRKQNGITELAVIVIPMEKGEDGIEISSTRIRNGEINRDGRLYFNPSWKNKSFHLPESMRLSLQEPFGEVLDSIPQDLDLSKVITIGDITTKLFNEQKTKPFLSIIDFQVQRQKQFSNLSELGFAVDAKAINVSNPQATITSELFNAIKNAFSSRNRAVIQVNGEEDLAVLPVLLIAPLGFSVFYGQPNHGLVKVQVTEDNKEKAYSLLCAFDIK